MKDISFLLADWEKFYFDLFNLKVNLLSLRIPEKKEGFDRLIIVAPKITPKMLYDKCATLFECHTPDKQGNKFTLIKSTQSKRIAQNSAYAVWLRDTIEGDENLTNLSTDDLIKKDICGITFEERLIYELKYFKETGNHLDTQTATLCLSSWSTLDDLILIPMVFWSKTAGFCIHWVSSNCFSPNVFSSLVRSRQVVL